MRIELGDWINTPRFCKVRIDAIFADAKDAIQAGYTEPTYFKDSEWVIKGKSVDRWTMTFAAVRKPGNLKELKEKNETVTVI